MKKRAQAAMEFLMSYGWAILVVLIAIGSLAYFGTLSPDNLLPEKCLISTGSGLFCDPNQVSTSATTNSVVMRVKNILNDDISVTGMTLDDPSCSYSGAGVVSADSTTDFTLSCASGLNSGDRIRASIAVSYSVGGSGLPKSTSGSLTTVVP